MADIQHIKCKSLQSFDAVGWAAGRPVKHWVIGCWRGYMSGARCRLAYGPADAIATHCLLLQQNPDWFLPFWYRLTRVVPGQRAVNWVCVPVVPLLVMYISCINKQLLCWYTDAEIDNGRQCAKVSVTRYSFVSWHHFWSVSGCESAKSRLRVVSGRCGRHMHADKPAERGLLQWESDTDVRNDDCQTWVCVGRRHQFFVFPCFLTPLFFELNKSYYVILWKFRKLHYLVYDWRCVWRYCL